jgi:hypothetical protein
MYLGALKKPQPSLWLYHTRSRESTQITYIRCHIQISNVSIADGLAPNEANLQVQLTASGAEKIIT